MRSGIRLFILIGLLCMSSCKSGTEEHKESYSPIAETAKEAMAAAELNRDVVVTINFLPGQNILVDSSKEQIEEAINEARKLGKVKNVDIAVWSDQDYPTGKEKLPRAQVDLARKRAKSIRQLIDVIEPDSDVKTFNMAKQPNSFQKWLKTRDAVVKNKLVVAGVVPHANSSIIYDRTSMALVFIEVR